MYAHAAVPNIPPLPVHLLLCPASGIAPCGDSAVLHRLSAVSRELSPRISLLECAVPRFLPPTPLECALTKMGSCKSFRMRSFEKRWGEGPSYPRTPAKPAASILPYTLPSYVYAKFFLFTLFTKL